MPDASAIGLLGYGRFGRALAGLCQAAGVPVRAYDPGPGAAPPAEVAVGSVPELAAAAGTLFVAAPLDAIPSALEGLAPHVGPDHLVADVGSVKVGPAAALERALGARVPWVATHPLFGPASLLLGERPLRVVVCPNARHPQAVERVSQLYRRLGCVVLERTPEEHDREMAQTHALVFFVAKGMLDAGVPLDAPLAPPSFQRMARVVESIRQDAGHLYSALHRHNPFAEGARRRLIDALCAADRGLTDAPHPPAEPPSIPDLGERSPELREARQLIDETDQAILELLARRAALSQRAGKAKAERGWSVADPARERQLMDARRARAAELGLDADAVADIFSAILAFSRSLQR